MRWLAPLFLVACTSPLNLFTVEDDLELGRQVHEEILASPETYPLVDPAEHPEAYAHFERIITPVLNSGDVAHRDDFDWEFYLIDDDVMNAFAAPGGYIYFYTGLIEFLDREDALAGVIGHEIAHSAERHTTEQLTRLYGLSLLLDIVLGDAPQVVSDVALGLSSLSFSRAHEREADEYSVFYLCETDYAANGAARFFEQLLEENTTEPPQFLSTHPASASRVEDINDLADDLGCSTSLNPDAEWQAFLASLP